MIMQAKNLVTIKMFNKSAGEATSPGFRVLHCLCGHSSFCFARAVESGGCRVASILIIVSRSYCTLRRAYSSATGP